MGIENLNYYLSILNTEKCHYQKRKKLKSIIELLESVVTKNFIIQ